MSVAEKVKSTLKIENIVASAALDGKIDLTQAAALFDSAEFDPENFPGVIIRFKAQAGTVLMFRSGNLVSTGARRFEDVEEGIKQVASKLEQANIISAAIPYTKYQNIVFSANLGKEINLNKLAISLGLEKVEYEPDKFPGLIYRLYVPKVVLLIFGSGKMVITGCKGYEDAEEAVEILVRDLEEQGILK